MFGLSKSESEETWDGELTFNDGVDHTLFPDKIKQAIYGKRKALSELNTEIASVEKKLTSEQEFIELFAVGEKKDVITLNVSGTIVTTKRETLVFVKDSVLAQQFDDAKWTIQGSKSARAVKEWSPIEVGEWVKGIEGIHIDVPELFTKNEINGLELLAINEFGLKEMGVSRPGTICLLMKAIKQLEKDADNFSVLIEYSPYCFGKIVDHLRFQHAYSKGIVKGIYLPTVRNDQMERYKKVVEYYFPGDSPDFLLPKVGNRRRMKRNYRSFSSSVSSPRGIQRPHFG